ncbi:dihydropteroate synthase [Formosa agariphila KMM 3901]|uniref:dihydropteroate synthase n=1 Tax=Formosa agariphila (strain DSM 15362 / KCTC 12365 / LMG 23005 / KMM 3901 / M-2Alg 35-1) TaxID=1347342 RepID=T2KNI0_FORAG|nr:dihydropteroate synthase [Formosa agariphila]CDF80427.1 dihydropteroate synthase [Formosa agariphila KMM 3901]
MGILNLTPDSFYDGGSYKNETDIINQVEHMLNAGATFIDVGAYSSRPDAEHVSEAEELSRILPVVELLIDAFPELILSIDTFRSTIAKACIEAGAAMINDISAGLLDEDMLETVGALKVPYIMMHMRGTPQTMQQHTDYNDLPKEMLFYFSERIALARQHGIMDIVVDPGFGFSKTLQQNFELLNTLELLKITDLPMLVGASRKSMIYKTLNTSAKHALNGTTVINTISLQKGTSILRVHDVKEAMECITLVNALKH